MTTAAYSLLEIVSAVDDFALSIGDHQFMSGKIYSLLGQNGAGKTELLNLLAFLRPPESGRVCFKGEAVDYTNRLALLAVRRKVGYLMQSPYLFNMSVWDNICYGLKLRAIAKDQIRERVDSVLGRLSISHLARRNAHRLSGGEAQRVALARTLVLDCDVVLLDEPTSNVDRGNVRAVEDEVLRLNRESGATVIFATHSRAQADRISDDLIYLADGRIARDEVDVIRTAKTCDAGRRP